MWQGRPRCYVCPLCGKGYLPSAVDARVLTLEHVPPRRLGGQEIALTCRTCNNLAGHTLDDEMIAREAQIDFVLDTMEHPLPGFVVVDGERLNANIQRSQAGIHIAPLETNNDPAVYNRVTQRFKNRKPDDTFNLELRKGFRPRPAYYALLRDACLVAFATLGYRYTFSPQLRPVREQLADTGTEMLRVFSVTIPKADKAARLIILVEEPTWLESIAVQMGRHLIFLPPLEGGDRLYENLATESDRGNDFDSTMKGKIVAWPYGPEHALDLAKDVM